MAWLTAITDLSDAEQAALVRRSQYGVVETQQGRFARLTLRPWPKLALPWDLWWGDYFHRAVEGDRCWLFYNQPRALPSFLALKFVVSSRAATLATFRGALEVLDYIARLKQTDAIVCDAVNWRISDRLMARWGWQPHKPQRWHRNYIKRFYGTFPAMACTTSGE
ncbi:MAG TPA: hypothetical protein VF306_23845 [Pirellulales bacterium]